MTTVTSDLRVFLLGSENTMGALFTGAKIIESIRGAKISYYTYM